MDNAFEIKLTNDKENAIITPSMENGMILNDNASLRNEKQEQVKAVVSRFTEKSRHYVEGSKKNLTIISTPTGFGKTDLLVKAVVSEISLWKNALVKGVDGKIDLGYSPIVFSGQNYNLMSEIEERLHSEMKKQGVEFGVGYYKGKDRVGCKRTEEMNLLNSASISTDKMCKNYVYEDGEKTEVFCPYYFSCPFIEQKMNYSRDQFGRGIVEGNKINLHYFEDNQNDVVFMPHAYLNKTNLPYNLAHPRFVIVDESIVEMIIDNAKIPFNGFTGRVVKSLTDEEFEYAKKNNLPFELMKQEVTGDYYRILQSFLNGLKEGVNPMISFIRAIEPEWMGEDFKSVNFANVFDKIAFMMRVNSATRKSDVITPEMTANVNVSAVAQMIGGKKHKFNREEARMWQILLDMFKRVEISREIITDKRIRFFEGHIELAWRNEFVYANSNVIILDASANEEIYRILFPEYNIEFVKIEGNPAQKNVLILGQGNSNSSIMPYETGDYEFDKKTIEASARKRVRLHNAIGKIIANHPGENGLIVSTKKMRNEIENWKYDAYTGFAVNEKNVHFRHFGALRGLDFAKKFGYACLLGKQELPADVVRRMGVALSYLNEDGAGTGEKEKRNITIKMRDGSETSRAVIGYANEYENMYCYQKREEEIIQGAGRLRTYHKDNEYGDWQTVYLISNVIPDGMVFDEIIFIGDFEKMDKFNQVKADNYGVFGSKELVNAISDAKTDASKNVTGHKLLKKFGFSESSIPAGYALVKCKAKSDMQYSNYYVDMAYVDGESEESILAHVKDISELQGWGYDMFKFIAVNNGDTPISVRLNYEYRQISYDIAFAEIAHKNLKSIKKINIEAEKNRIVMQKMPVEDIDTDTMEDTVYFENRNHDYIPY